MRETWMNCEKYEEYLAQHYLSNRKKWLIYHEEFEAQDIHLDVVMMPPDSETGQDFWILTTMGMSEHKMNVRKEFESYNLERAELVMFLPADWKFSSPNTMLQRDKVSIGDNWPLYLMQDLARLPICYNTWLGARHFIKHEDLQKSTKFHSVLLLNALDADLKLMEDCILDKDYKVNFYQMYLLYQEEQKMIDKHGEAGIDFLMENGLWKKRITDLNRQPVVLCA